MCKHKHKQSVPEQHFLIIFKKQSFKKSHFNTTEGWFGGPQPSFSWKWGEAKLNQTDG